MPPLGLEDSAETPRKTQLFLSAVPQAVPLLQSINHQVMTLLELWGAMDEMARRELINCAEEIAGRCRNQS